MIIHCIGILRSGSTLQYNMVTSLVEKLGLGRGEGSFIDSEFKDSKTYKHWEEDDVFHVIKMHNLHPRADELTAGGAMKVCSIYRDIRDVAVSLKLKQDLQGDKFLNLIDAAISGYYLVKEIPGIFIQKYEQVLPDLSTAIEELAEFLNITPDKQTVEHIAKECSLSNAKKITKNLQDSIPIDLQGLPTLEADTIMQNFEDKKTCLHPNHISKNNGASGVWRNELAQHELEAITTRHINWLGETGYLSTSSIFWGADEAIYKSFTKPHGFFIEIGAGDGIKDSHTLNLENTGWQGVLVEQNIEQCAKCMLNRPKAAVLNYSCVSHQYHKALLYGFKTASRSKSKQITGIPYPLTRLFDDIGIEHCDLLVINTVRNGFDILRGIDFFKYRPEYIIINELTISEIPAHLSGIHYEPIKTVEENHYVRTVMYRSPAHLTDNSASPYSCNSN